MPIHIHGNHLPCPGSRSNAGRYLQKYTGKLNRQPRHAQSSLTTQSAQEAAQAPARQEAAWLWAHRLLTRGTLHIRNDDLHALVVSLQLRHLKADLVVDELQAVAILLRAVALAILKRGVACMCWWVKMQPSVPAAALDRSSQAYLIATCCSQLKIHRFECQQSKHSGRPHPVKTDLQAEGLGFAVPCKPTASGVWGRAHRRAGSSGSG